MRKTLFLCGFSLLATSCATPRGRTADNRIAPCNPKPNAFAQVINFLLFGGSQDIPEVNIDWNRFALAASSAPIAARISGIGLQTACSAAEFRGSCGDTPFRLVQVDLLGPNGRKRDAIHLILEEGAGGQLALFNHPKAISSGLPDMGMYKMMSLVASGSGTMEILFTKCPKDEKASFSFNCRGSTILCGGLFASLKGAP